MKGVIYARYSSDNQREESIEGQIRENTAFAKRMGIEIVNTYIDRAMTAKTDSRPEFQRMIKDSYKRKFDAIIVWKLDRFARNRYDSANYKAKLKKNGVRVLSAKENISDDASGILMESVLEGMAEYYSVELAEKVIRGMTENALKGRNNGMSIPFGYVLDRETDKLLVDDTTVPIVREIFELYAEGKLIKEIAAWLKEKGIKTAKGKDFTHSIVRWMLTNRKYIGEYKFKDIVIPNGVPRIISDELFEKVQAQLEKNTKAPARHKAEDDYLLTLKLFCGECGGAMAGESGTSPKGVVHRYYKCQNNKKKKTCTRKAVRKEWIEDLVVRETLKMLDDKKLLAIIAERVYYAQQKENPRLPRLREQLADINKRIDNIIAAIEQGILTDATKQRLSDLEKEKKELSITIAAEEIQKPFLTKEQILFALQKFKNGDISTKEGKQRIIDGFVNSVMLYEDKMIITYNYKDGAQTVALSDINGSDMEIITEPK